MGKRIRKTNRRSNLRKLSKNKKRKSMKRKSMKRRNNRRKTMLRKNSRRNFLRGGAADSAKDFGKNVIVSMGKLVDSSSNEDFLNRFESRDMVFVSAASNNAEKIQSALTAYQSLEFEGEYVKKCRTMPELDEALKHGFQLARQQTSESGHFVRRRIGSPEILNASDLEAYNEGVNVLAEMVGANMRTESRHDKLVSEYTEKGAQCEPNKSKLSADVLNSFSQFLNGLSAYGAIFIEDEWFPDGPVAKRGRRGRPAYNMGMTDRSGDYFISTGEAPTLGAYLNLLNKTLMGIIGSHDVEGGKSFFADLEVPFALMVNSRAEIDQTRDHQKRFLELLESSLDPSWLQRAEGLGELSKVFIEKMNETFSTVKYDEIFVQTDIYSNAKEMDDLLAILCLSRMCNKLLLSFDSEKLGINFRKMQPFLTENDFMGGATVELLN
jgi:hypothetical protein